MNFLHNTVYNTTSLERQTSSTQMYNNFQNQTPPCHYVPNIPVSQPPQIPIPSLDPRLNFTPPVLDPLATHQPEAKSDDEFWIETWLSRIGKIDIKLDSTNIKSVEATTSNSKQGIAIHEAKMTLRKCLIILNKLTQTQKELQKNVETLSSSEWKRKTIEIGSLKDDFTQSIGKFSSTEIMTVLRKAVEKRRKKRVAIKKRKASNREVYAAKIEDSKKAEKEADMWLKSMKDQVERAKMEEDFKKDADCILAEVTKKKSDARKQLSLVQALVKLRSGREQAAVQRGEKISLEDSHAFKRVTDKLIKMWQDVLQVYTKEEQGLRLMLEQTAYEDNKAAKIAKEKIIIREWENVFFGPKHVPSPDNQIFWALTAAERDVETFVAIRRSWDTFLVPHNHESGSNIPIGWVLPESSSNLWNKYLRR